MTRWALGVAAAVVTFAIAGWLGLPAAARWGIETVASRELGRTLRVGQITANPVTLNVSASGLTMAQADAAAPEPFVAIDRLTVNLSVASLRYLATVVDSLQIDGLRGLASTRAATVRDWLEATGKVARERMFVVEPRITDAAPASSAADKPAQAATTGVEFALK